MKSNKGITLIALIITIIVLAILVGVSVSRFKGKNSIVSKAEDAAWETSFNVSEDAVLRAVMSVHAEFVDTWSEHTNQSFLKDYLTAQKILDALGGKDGMVKYNLYQIDYYYSEDPDIDVGNGAGWLWFRSRDDLRTVYVYRLLEKNNGFGYSCDFHHTEMTLDAPGTAEDKNFRAQQ